MPEVCVGRVGRAHGVRGEVAVEVRTDEPQRRFVAGARLDLRGRHPGLPSSVTISGVRRHQDRLLVSFEELTDRTAAETTRGALLYVDVSADETTGEPEEFYDHQLVGLAVESPAGTRVGEVTEVLHHGAQDLLVLDLEGREALVPFVEALVPEIDLAGGRLVVADRPGLLDPQ